VTAGTDTRYAILERHARDRFSCHPHEVAEVLWGLVGEGLAYVDRAGQGPDNWHWAASALGIKVANGGSWEPRDPTGYLTRLRNRAPGLDDDTIRYVQEALAAFNARCYLATSVMLGVASERAFGRLAHAFAQCRPASERPRLTERLENPRTMYHRRFEEFRKRLEPVRDSLPDGLADNLSMDAIADLLRVSRNNAGHPTGKAIDEDTAFTHLQVAAQYLVKMTNLSEHFETTSA
jgi:hypothetical protein